MHDKQVWSQQHLSCLDLSSNNLQFVLIGLRLVCAISTILAILIVNLLRLL